VLPFLESNKSLLFPPPYQFLVLLGVIVMTHQWLTTPSPVMPEKEEEEPDPPRNFTMEQLRYFDGTKDEKTDEDKPVYLSVNGQVFDVSDGRDFYGPEGPYSNFAGHECGVALAKMSFDTEHLDDLEGVKNLPPSEKQELDGWIEKFTYYRPYPIKGRLVPNAVLKPLADRVLSKEDLAKHDGSSDDIPEGYATAPIYLGAGDKVYDVSFGGVTFYGPKGGYNRFAGKDASRALAKMSFDPEDVENTSIDDLEDKQRKILDDWIKTFADKKKYPVVGKLKK
jgi:membrane-associated progesterone receptor component